jgi:hypothetical protein
MAVSFTHLAPGIHWVGGWIGPRAGLEAVEKRKIFSPTGNQTPVFQAVAIPTELSQLVEYSG